MTKYVIGLLAQPEQCRKEQRGNGEYVCNCKSGECPELAQPAVTESHKQEPVAVYGYCPECGAEGVARERRPDGNDCCANGHTYPSRTANKTPQRKPLTDEQISDIWCRVSNTDFVTADTHEFARAIEAAHGIKE